MLCAVALMLLLDGSTSLSDEQWSLTVEAHARTLQGPRVAQMVAREGGIALAATAFAGTPTDLTEWRMLHTQADLDGFAAELRAHTQRSFQTGDGTYTGNAIRHGLNRLKEAPECDRQVLDVATDGESNGGIHTTTARAQAEASEVQVNVVAIRTGANEDPVAWAREHVVTSTGFVLEARTWAEWGRAIERKIVMELAAR